MGLKILIVDDAFSVHTTVRLYLERGGHSVVSAYDGTQALRELQDQKFDLLITDQVMPKMSGEELVERVNEMGYDTQTAFFSAVNEKELDSLARKSTLGAFSKLKMQSLKNVLQKILELYERKKKST